MVRKIGIEPESIEPEIYLTDDEKKSAKKFRESIAKNDEILIGINSTSGNSSPNLNASEYKRLIEKLLQVEKMKIIVTDPNPPAEILNIKNVHYPMVGKLREDIIKFSALDVLISASTGPMHICAALKVPTISVFCPLTACSPKLWGPLGNKSIILLPEENYCKTQCPGDPKICRYEGESGINAEVIFKRILNFFGLNN
jgi:heptosyltransferase-2